MTPAWEAYQTKRVEELIRQSKGRLLDVDEVTVMKLDYRKPSVDLGTMAISHSEYERLFIVKEITVVGTEAKDIAQQWSDLTIHPQSYAACYMPHHALRFRSKGRAVSELVICFMCEKATIPGTFGAKLVGLETHGAASGPAYQAFRHAIESRVGAHKNAKSAP